MAFRFDIVKAQHIILFFIHSLGGAVDISRLYLLMYLADLKHLSKYGMLVLGDSYIAMKYGPAPTHVLEIFRQLQEGHSRPGRQFQVKLHIAVNAEKQVVATSRYNSLHLSDSEVECMFEIIRKYKGLSFESLSAVTKDKAWIGASESGEISLAGMAVASGATTEMISYIEQSYRDEINSFSPGHETK